MLPREAPRLSANVRLMTICVLFCGAEPLTSFGNIRCNASGEASVMVAVEAAFRSMSFPLFTSIPALVCSPGCNAVPGMAMSSGDCQPILLRQNLRKLGGRGRLLGGIVLPHAAAFG